MKSMSLKNVSLAVLIAIASTQITQAQRAANSTQTASTQTATASSQPANVPAAPQTFKAKYEGGVFGYNRKIEGTMSFDDAENRLVFRDKQGQTLFVVPYSTVAAAFADTQSRRPTSSRVIASSVPYGLGLPALLFKKKHRYLTLQYRDADTERVGTTSFKLGNRDLLQSVLNTLGAKAGLTKRGEIFVRPRTGETPASGDYEVATPPSEN